MTRALLVAPGARAAGYPERPLTLLVPVQPGGGVDLVARTIAAQLERALGQRFVAENVSGGGGAIAAQRVAAAAPDGYTLLLAYVATHGTLPAQLGYPGFDAVQWYGVVGPAGLPAPVTAVLAEAIRAALDAPALRERLAGEALEPLPLGPAEFALFVAQELSHWSALVRERGLEIGE